MLNDKEKQDYIDAVMKITPILLRTPLFSPEEMDRLWRADRCGCPECAATIKEAMDRLC